MTCSFEPPPAPAAGPKRTFVLVLVGIAGALLAWLLLPLAAPLFAGVILAAILEPLYARALRRCRGRRALASGIVTALAVVVLGVPAAAVAALALREIADDAVTLARVYDEEGVEGLLERVPRGLRPIARTATDLMAWSQGRSRDEPPPAQPPPAQPPPAARAPAFAGVAAWCGWITEKVAAFVLDCVIAVLALFCLLAWGDGLVRWCKSVVPLPAAQSERLVDELREVTRAVVFAVVVTAVAQTAIATVGYAMAGVSSLPLASTVTLVAALIPVIGAAVVTCAIGVLQILQGDVAWGLFLVAWGFVVVNLSENFLTPWLCGPRIHMHAGLVLFAILGGLAVFGALGIIAGPLVVAFFRAVVELSRDMRRETAPLLLSNET